MRSVCPARPFAFAWADMDGRTDYVQWKVDPFTREVLFDARWDDYKKMQDVMEDDRITKVLHNPRYDITMYDAIGIKTRGPVIDTQILAHVATAGQELSYQLKPLAKKWVDYDDGDEKALRKEVTRLRQQAKKLRHAFGISALGGRDPWKSDMWMAPESLTKRYAIGDVIRCMLLMHLWYDEVRADAKMASLFDREHELMWVLKDMEDTGTRVFPDTVRSLREFYLDYQAKQVAVANANGGTGLNYESTTQMSEVFYERRGHPPVFTETWNAKKERHNYSLNGDQLVKMANGYQYETTVNVKFKNTFTKQWETRTRKIFAHKPPDPLAKAVLEFKAAGQTIGSFLDVYERYWVQETWSDVLGRHQGALDSGVLVESELRALFDGAGDEGVWVLHPGYKQTGTITGRLSCSDPNLMQVASETTGRRKADIQSRPREAFGPRPGCWWYLPDYSQIEVWLFAFLSGEEKMQQTLLSGAHFHTAIATQVFGGRPDFKEHKEYYVKCAKLIMFAKLYGGGLKKLAGLLKMPPAEAKLFIEQYEAELPGVPAFMKTMIARATRDGVIYNPFGRRYTFEPHYAYTSVNYLIQGTAADVMKNALIRIHRTLTDQWPGVKLLLTIHDEIIVEVPDSLHCKALMRDVVAAMQGDREALGMPVPLPVEMKMVPPGGRWAKTVKPSAETSRAIGAYVKA